jgi:hypothetical protein
MPDKPVDPQARMIELLEQILAALSTPPVAERQDLKSPHGHPAHRGAR